MKKVLILVGILLALPIAAYAAVGGHGVVETETNIKINVVKVEEVSKETLENITDKIKSITGNQEIVVKVANPLISNAVTDSNDGNQVTITKETLPATLSNREIKAAVALPSLGVTISAEQIAKPVSVVVTVQAATFSEIATSVSANNTNIEFFLEHYEEGERAISIPYNAAAESEAESYAFVDDEGDNPKQIADGNSKNLLIRNLRYEGNYNLEHRKTTNGAVSFAEGDRTISFQSQFVEVAAASSDGGCNAGLSSMALLALAGVVLMFKKDKFFR
ncbi:MAG: hypothetical protein LBU13_10885 [Synergistaceae bacterium]|nr:hypothetical protein [Synergistaceae bacterium]